MNQENQEHKAYREQYFSEMSDQDRIKLLAKELDRTQRELAIVSSALNALIEHKHCDGDVVCTLKGRNALDSYPYFKRYEHWY